jgi:hypothetical protein
LAGNLRVKKAMAFLAADVFQTHARIDVPRRSEERLDLDLGQPAQCPASSNVTSSPPAGNGIGSKKRRDHFVVREVSVGDISHASLPRPQPSVAVRSHRRGFVGIRVGIGGFE